MSNTQQTAYQFAYDISSSPGYKSSQLSPRRFPGPNLRENLKAVNLPVIRLSNTIPRIPPKTHKAHRNHLQSYYDPSRALVTVLRLRQTLFHLNIIEYIDTVPSQPARGAPPVTSPNALPPSDPVSSLSDISSCVYAYGLLPMQQIFHQANPSMKGHQWLAPGSGADEMGLDKKLIRVFHFNTLKRSEANGVVDYPAPRMIAFVQEPWVLSHRDFTNFVKTKSMPQAPRQLTGKERLWAKIYDECTRASCYWFVVTTYRQWSFGVFSEGYQSVFITFDIPSPNPYVPLVTPLQTLYYWMASCMGLPETFVPSQMMESIHPRGTPQPSQQSHQYTGDAEWNPAPVFQYSESEASSDSEEEEHRTTNFCYADRHTSEIFPQVVGDLHLSVPTQALPQPPPSGHHPHTRRFPVAGNQLTKDAVLPPRHWGSEEKAKMIEDAHQDDQKNDGKYRTFDWLEERDWDNWGDGGPCGDPSTVNGITSTMRNLNLRERWVNTRDGAPPSPTLSAVSRDGSMVVGKRGGAVGKAQFAIAPKHPRRTFAFQA